MTNRANLTTVEYTFRPLSTPAPGLEWPDLEVRNSSGAQMVLRPQSVVIRDRALGMTGRPQFVATVKGRQVRRVNQELGRALTTYFIDDSTSQYQHDMRDAPVWVQELVNEVRQIEYARTAAR